MLKRAIKNFTGPDQFKLEPKDQREITILLLSGTVALSQSIDDRNFLPLKGLDVGEGIMDSVFTGPCEIALTFGAVFLRVSADAPASFGIAYSDAPPRSAIGGVSTGDGGGGDTSGLQMELDALEAVVANLQTQVNGIGSGDGSPVNFPALITAWMATLPNTPPSTAGVWWNDSGIPVYSTL